MTAPPDSLEAPTLRFGAVVVTLGNDQSIGSRSEQQDYFAADVAEGVSPHALLVLADGMGGHEGGALASVIAVDAFVQAFRTVGSDAPASRLRESVQEANRAVVTVARDRGSDMGTTLLALSVEPNGLHWVSVGDSVLLACYGDFVTRLNHDHNLAEDRAQAGVDPSEPLDPAEANCLTSYLGLDELPGIQLSERMDLERAECLILASDGLTDALELVEIGAIVASTQDAQSAAEALVRGALGKQRPSQDNISVLVLRLESGGGV